MQVASAVSGGPYLISSPRPIPSQVSRRQFQTRVWHHMTLGEEEEEAWGRRQEQQSGHVAAFRWGGWGAGLLPWEVWVVGLPRCPWAEAAAGGRAVMSGQCCNYCQTSPRRSSKAPCLRWQPSKGRPTTCRLLRLSFWTHCRQSGEAEAGILSAAAAADLPWAAVVTGGMIEEGMEVGGWEVTVGEVMRGCR